MPIGPIRPEPEMLPNHLNPAQALEASQILRAKHMLPIHFGTFINSFDEPGEVEAALTGPWRRAARTHPRRRCCVLASSAFIVIEAVRHRQLKPRHSGNDAVRELRCN